MTGIVTTLPITPNTSAPFVRSFSILVADIIARLLGDDLFVCLNVKGLKADKRDRAQYYAERYIGSLARLAVKNEAVCRDDSCEYGAYVDNIVARMFSSGVLRFEELENAWCPCGAVEMPAEAIQQAVSDQKRKSLILGEGRNGNVTLCAKCGHPLKYGKERVLLFRSTITHHAFPVYPDQMSSKFEEGIAWLSDCPMVVTRNHRAGEQMKLPSGESLVVDADFRWALLLSYVTAFSKKICLVVSRSSLFQAAKSIVLAKTLDEKVEINLVTHPVIRIIDQKEKVSPLTLEEFLVGSGSPIVPRAFMALGLQWQSLETRLASSELFFLEKMATYREAYLASLGGIPFDHWALPEIPRLFNRSVLQKTFKSVRQGNDLEERLKSLLAAVTATNL